MISNAAAAVSPQLSRLLAFLQDDPANLRLIDDAAARAFEENELALAQSLVEQHAAIKPLPGNMRNLQGLIAIARQQFQEAIAIFEGLRISGDDNAGLRFNLAWAKAMVDDFAGALDLLDDEVLAVSERAPSLKVQMLHHLDRYDEALACGAGLAERFPANKALMGALATLALDAEKADLAEAYAKRAGDNEEARTVLGFLALSAHDAEGSAPLFDQALAARPNNPRAWIGKGLTLLVSGDANAGADAIDRGAGLFQDHIGSWVASGWAHFLRGDNDRARASFERALSIDDTFAESHGGLAVIDVVQGRPADASRRCEIASRLDRNCFGAALARSLLLDRSGHGAMAQKIRNIAMATPIGPNGETLAQAIVSFGLARQK